MKIMARYGDYAVVDYMPNPHCEHRFQMLLGPENLQLHFFLALYKVFIWYEYQNKFVDMWIERSNAFVSTLELVSFALN